MATAPQPLKIVYGSITFGTGLEDTYRIKDGTFSFEAKRLDGTFSFEVLVWGTSESNLISRCNTLIEAMRDRRKNITVQMNGTSQVSFSQSSNVNRNSMASCIQLDGGSSIPGMFSGVTRQFKITIDVDLPPPTSTNGRTELSVKLSYKANRERVCVIQAQYNSTSSTTALAQYQADSTYYTDVLTYWSSGSVEWKLIREEWDSGDALLDVQLTVTKTYEEIIRKIRIDYGSLTLGTSDPYRILDGWAFNRLRAQYGSVSFSVRVYAADASALATACNALEEGFAERRKTLKLYYNGVVQNDFTVSQIYTDSTAESTSKEGEFFGLTTRDYSVKVVVDLPPKNTDGITEEDVRVTYTPSEQLVITISARYNSILGTSAKTLADTNFATYCTGVLTALAAGLTFNLISQNYDNLPVIDNQIKITRVYEEILFAESSGALDVASIRGLVVNVTIGKTWPGDWIPSSSGQPSNTGQSTIGGVTSSTGRPKRLMPITISGSCPVQKATDIYTIYSGTLRDYLIAHAKSKASVVLMAIHTENPVYNPTKNTLEFTIQADGAVDGYGQLVSSSQTIEQQNVEGKLIVPVWDGTKYGAFEIDTKGKKMKTIVETKMIVQAQDGEPPERIPMNVSTGARWVKISTLDHIQSKNHGNLLDDNENFKLVEYKITTVWEWVTSPLTSTSTSGSLSTGL